MTVGRKGGPRQSREASREHERQLRAVGAALESRTAEVLAQIVAHSKRAGPVIDDDFIKESFERIGTISTKTIAAWMAGADPEEGRAAGAEAFELFGQMAARRALPLNEIVKRCLRWHAAVEHALREIAEQLGSAPEVLAKALSMLQITLHVTLVRVCEVFESERARTDEELAHRQEELAFMATHDQLTGLPNRTLIMDRGEQLLVRARRHRTPVAALLMNIDNFKAINDTLGHGAGDELLQAIAARLDGVVRDTDALGRLGADEFVVLAEEVSLAAGPELIAERLLGALREPFKLAGTPETDLTVTASLGVAMGERSSAEHFLRDADIALHRAKWEGKDRYLMFEAGMQDAVQIHMALEMDLRRALENGEFFLLYQPTFDLSDMTPTGVEALIRWEHPERGIVQPNDFIPLLEETGLIVDVGSWVLKEACRQGAIWRQSGYPIGMAVNVSGRQLDTDEFVTAVRSAIAESGMDPGALTLEITETTLMRNAEETAGRLRAVKELGVRIAIDDFGTGYSSLAHLQQFPVDSLKIDRSFIAQLSENPEGETLIRTLVQLGKALSIETLAEGIEQQTELSMLQREHCDSGQGFLFARPLSVHDVAVFLQTWTPGSAADRAPASSPA